MYDSVDEIREAIRLEWEGSCRNLTKPSWLKLEQIIRSLLIQFKNGNLQLTLLAVLLDDATAAVTGRGHTL